MMLARRVAAPLLAAAGASAYGGYGAPHYGHHAHSHEYAIDEGAERTWWPMAARDAELSSTVPMHQPPTMNWPPMATPCATVAPPAVPSAMPQRELRLLGSGADALHKDEEVTRRRWKLVM